MYNCSGRAAEEWGKAGKEETLLLAAEKVNH